MKKIWALIASIMIVGGGSIAIEAGTAQAAFCTTIRTQADGSPASWWTTRCSDPGHVIEVNTRGRCRYYKVTNPPHPDRYVNGVGTGYQESGSCGSAYYRVISVEVKVIRLT